MLANRKEFFGGLVMMIIFIIVLIVFFSPIFTGKNGLDYLDNLYNSISKGSAYYIPKVKEECYPYKGVSVNVSLDMADNKIAGQTALLLKAGGAEITVTGTQLTVYGDLGKILENALADADAMYYNRGNDVSGKYGYNEKLILYNWWKALNEIEKGLKKQKKFKEAKGIALVVKKAVESSYNYYEIEPQKIGDRWGIVLFSLIFYVIYTMWYGFAIMFMFEGWGLKLGH
ncbi:hypothetical protein ACFL9T_04185 [Thermodesulfobacteriota bacterium]